MFHTLLIPLDGTPESDGVLELAARVAKPGLSSIYVLCVVDPGYSLSPGDERGVAPDGLAYPPAADQTALAGRAVTAAVQRLRKRGFAAEGAVHAGQPADAIVDEARRIRAGVIVMGHRHLSRLQRWVERSTAGAVIERAPCPVLVDTARGA